MKNIVSKHDMGGDKSLVSVWYILVSLNFL